MNDEQYAQITAAVASNQTEHQSFKRRLDEHDAALKRQSDILIALQRQSNAIEKVAGSVNRVERTVSSIDNRVSVLQKEPAQKWKKVVFEIIKYVVIAAAGFAVSMLFKTT